MPWRFELLRSLMKQEDPSLKIITLLGNHVQGRKLTNHYTDFAEIDGSWQAQPLIGHFSTVLTLLYNFNSLISIFQLQKHCPIVWHTQNIYCCIIPILLVTTSYIQGTPSIISHKILFLWELVSDYLLTTFFSQLCDK